MQLLKGIRLLEEAYREKDWDKVVESYEMISGDRLEIEDELEPLNPASIEEILGKKPKRGRPKKVTKTNTPDTPIPSGYPPEAKWIQKELEESLLANDGFGKSQVKLVESVIKPKKITDVILNNKKPRGYRKNPIIVDEIPPEPSPKPQKQPRKASNPKNDQEPQEERRQPRTEPVRFRGNSFVDDGSLALEDKLIDKKLKKGKGGKGWKRAQPRPQHEFVEVECGTRSCDAILNVSPELYMSDTTYFCTKCLGKKR